MLGLIGYLAKEVEGKQPPDWSKASAEDIARKEHYQNYYQSVDFSGKMSFPDIIDKFNPPPFIYSPPPSTTPPAAPAPAPTISAPAAPSADATREAAKRAKGRSSTLLSGYMGPGRARTKGAQKTAIQKSQVGLSSTTKQTLLGTA